MDASVELTPGPDWPLAAATRPQADGIVLTHGIAQIDVRGDNQGRFFGRAAGVRNFYIQQFKQLLKDNKDYLEKKDLDNQQFLSGLFAFADRNNDGKLTEKELNAFFDAIDDGANASVTLQVADHGAGLFELLDANRDSKLSIRELRTGWERIAPWDKGKTGVIAKDQIPRQYQSTIRQGPPEDGRFRQVTRFPGNGMAPVGSSRGPVWFRKMDRNGDGDVSPASGSAASRTSRRSTPTTTASSAPRKPTRPTCGCARNEREEVTLKPAEPVSVSRGSTSIPSLNRFGLLERVQNRLRRALQGIEERLHGTAEAGSARLGRPPGLGLQPFLPPGKTRRSSDPARWLRSLLRTTKR